MTHQMRNGWLTSIDHHSCPWKIQCIQPHMDLEVDMVRLVRDTFAIADHTTKQVVVANNSCMTQH